MNKLVITLFLSGLFVGSAVLKCDEAKIEEVKISYEVPEKIKDLVEPADYKKLVEDVVEAYKDLKILDPEGYKQGVEDSIKEINKSFESVETEQSS